MKELNAQTIAVNFCKNPLCEDFGSLNPDNYLLSKAQGSKVKIACKSCKSLQNLLDPSELENEITQQNQRKRSQLPCCNNEACSSFGLNVHLYPENYHSFGFSGEKQRYRCKRCQSTVVDRFSVENPQLETHVTILGLLLTGFSPKEVAKKLHIQAKTFNDHLKTMATICRQKSAIFDFHWQNSVSDYCLGSNFVSLQPKSDNGVLLLATCDLNSHYMVDHNVNLTTVDSAPQSRFDAKGRLIEKSFISLHNRVHKDDMSLPVIKRLESVEARVSERLNELNPLEDKTKIKYPLKSVLVKPHYAATAHFCRIAAKVKSKPLVLFLDYDPLLGYSALNAFNYLRQQQDLDIAYLIDDIKWAEGKHSSKPEVIAEKSKRALWTLSEQRHIRGPSEQRALGTLVESNLDPRKAHAMPGLSPVTEYLNRFHALFSVTINEPRRRLRPEGLAPLLDIYRAWNNLCHQETAGQTPAVNAGISEKPLSLDQLLG